MGYNWAITLWIFKDYIHSLSWFTLNVHKISKWGVSLTIGVNYELIMSVVGRTMRLAEKKMAGAKLRAPP